MSSIASKISQRSKGRANSNLPTFRQESHPSMNTFVDQSSPGSRLEGYPVLRCKLIQSQFVQVKERDHEITGMFNSPLRATVDPVDFWVPDRYSSLAFLWNKERPCCCGPADLGLVDCTVSRAKTSWPLYCIPRWILVMSILLHHEENTRG